MIVGKYWFLSSVLKPYFMYILKSVLAKLQSFVNFLAPHIQEVNKITRLMRLQKNYACRLIDNCVVYLPIISSPKPVKILFWPRLYKIFVWQKIDKRFNRATRCRDISYETLSNLGLFEIAEKTRWFDIYEIVYF